MTDVHAPDEPMPSADAPSLATREAIRAAIAADLAPVRARSLRDRALIVLAGALLALASAAPTFGMNLAGATPDPARGAIAGGVMMLLGSAAIVACFAPAGRPWLRAAGRVAALAVLLAGWLGYLVVIATAPAPASAVELASLACAMRSVVAGVFAGVAALWAFRNADPWTPARTGALLGAAAGGVAAAGVGIGCGSSALGHLLVGHGLVVPVLAVVGALVARRTLRP